MKIKDFTYFLGMMGLLVGHPLDTIKVRQQILPGRSKIFAVAKSTYKVEGVRFI